LGSIGPGDERYSIGIEENERYMKVYKVKGVKAHPKKLLKAGKRG